MWLLSFCINIMYYLQSTSKQNKQDSVDGEVAIPVTPNGGTSTTFSSTFREEHLDPCRIVILDGVKTECSNLSYRLVKLFVVASDTRGDLIDSSAVPRMHR